MNAKFSLTSETKNHCGITLYRIKAEKDFGDVNKGELGGFVEKESNLSVSGDAWVSENAMVYGDSQVSGNALVSENAFVSGNACVYGNALVSGNAWVYGDALVYGDAWVSGNALVYGKIKLEFGHCFGWKSKYWNVTEVENEDGVLLIDQYKPATVETEIEELTLYEVCKLIGREIKIKI